MLDTLHKTTISHILELEAEGQNQEAKKLLQSFLKLRSTVLHTEKVLNSMTADVLEIKHTADVLQNAVNTALEDAGFTCINGDWMSPVEYKKWLADEHIYGELQSEILDEMRKGGEDE